MAYDRHYVSAFPIGNSGGWIEESRKIDYPTQMKYGYEQLRFVVPTEHVVRDLKPFIPQIGRAWDTNLLMQNGKLVTHDEAFDAALKVANIEKMPFPTMSERTNEWYDKRNKLSAVYQAIHQKLWKDALWAVEMYESCGDDGHTEYRFVGVALVRKDDVVEFINQRFGRYESKVTFV